MTDDIPVATDQVRKSIIYKLTEQTHTNLKEMAFRQTLAEKKNISQNEIVNRAIDFYYEKLRKQWERLGSSSRSI